MLKFFVPGIPAPGGSKTARPVFRKGGGLVLTASGRPIINVVDAGGEKTANWRSIVAAEASKASSGLGLFTGALTVDFLFIMPRPKSHYRTGQHAGELKPDAPTYHTSKPDCLKLMRSSEDAMAGVLFADDAANSIVRGEKRYGEKTGAWITVSRIELLPSSSGATANGGAPGLERRAMGVTT